MSGLGIAVALRARELDQPSGAPADEYRLASAVTGSSVVAIAISDSLSTTKLDALEANIELELPEHDAEYIERNIIFAAQFAGNPISSELRHYDGQAKAGAFGGRGLSVEETKRMHAAMMRNYAKCLKSPTNLDPTVGDALQATLARSQRRLPVLIWTETDRAELAARSEQITALRVAGGYPTNHGAKRLTDTGPARPSWPQTPTRQQGLGY
ncbi:hypothetical protein ABZX12_26445 [Kribbella sp. NPDC003505]|uniref:hypothetical protein n=1 Tax=Kribbella sp. NPDC003505 TaxID=3154448 RepID=UPI0033AB4F09